MAEALADAGAAVHVITGIPHYPQWRIDDEKYRTGNYWEEQDGAIRVSRCRHAVPAVPNFLGRLRMEAGFFRRAARTARADRSDIVICVTPMLSGLAAGLMTRRGRPVGVLVQDLTGNAAAESGSTGGLAARLIGRIEYLLLARCQLVGVITPRFREILTSHGVPLHSILDLPNFAHIDPVAASPQQAKRHLGWDPNKITVVHTGNIGRKQGLGVVAQAATLAADRHPDVLFVIVGDGNEKQALSDAAAKSSALQLHAPVDEKIYPWVLAAADFLLVTERPGVKEMSLPSKLTSYCAAGRPIIAAVEPTGITNEWISRFGIAHTAPPGDAAAILGAVEWLQSDRARVAALIAASANYYQNHLTRAGATSRYRAFAASLRSRTAYQKRSLTGVPTTTLRQRTPKDSTVALRAS